MNDPQTGPEDAEEPPRAKARETPWSFSAVWIVPVVAAIVAGYLVYDRVRDYGPGITIRFQDASGLKTGQTPVRYRGVQIGEVTALELSEDRQHVLVKARLRRSAESVAREGTIFWIVRPEVGIGNITGLGTVISGPHIELSPGAGKPKKEFLGLERPPVISERKGLGIVLLSSRLGSLKLGSPVYYRGIEVGAVQDSRLADDATMVLIRVIIHRRFAGLVRKGTKFWDVSGMDIRAGLFRGLEIDVESLRSLVAGGIAFATPDDTKDEPVKGGTAFPLHDKPKKEWLEWAPKIRIPPEAGATGGP
jgi:paraquat-inducible protein B